MGNFEENAKMALIVAVQGKIEEAVMGELDPDEIANAVIEGYDNAGMQADVTITVAGSVPRHNRAYKPKPKKKPRHASS